MFKVLEETRLDKIKIGEVFACDGCWEIYYKISKFKVMILAWDHGIYDMISEGFILTENFVGGKLYKLPLEVQNLFITN